MAPGYFAQAHAGREAAFARFEAWQAADPAGRADAHFDQWLFREDPALHDAIGSAEQAGS